MPGPVVGKTVLKYMHLSGESAELAEMSSVPRHRDSSVAPRTVMVVICLETAGPGAAKTSPIYMLQGWSFWVRSYMQILLSPLPKVNWLLRVCHHDPLSIPVLLKKGHVLTMNLFYISFTSVPAI